jgi:ferredoxin-type protein NapH
LRLRTYRRTSQVVFTVLTLGGLVGIATTGLIYPYFFCYSCPWDVGACPIGILEHSVIDIQLVGLWVGLALLALLAGFMTLMALIFGRSFCGWACPVGLLQDITRKLELSERLNRKPGNATIDPRWKYVKFLMLASIPVTSYITLDLFYTTFCPVGGVTGTVPTLTFYSAEWLFGTTFPIKVMSVTLFVILILLVVRGWCKYLCPIGAFFGLFNKFSATRVKRLEYNCIDCGFCERSCPMDIKKVGKEADVECIVCGRCVDACRFSALEIKVRLPNPNVRKTAFWIAAVAVSAIVMISGIFIQARPDNPEAPEVTGYDRSEAINSEPCLGCLALDPVSPEGWFEFDEDTDTHQDFVEAELERSPVLLHYRTVVCAACDEMEPHIEALEDEYGNSIKFIHINLDLWPKDSPEYLSYDDYDLLGTPAKHAGVPLFAVVTYNKTEEGNRLVFWSLYGSSADGGLSKKSEIEAVINNATAMYREAVGSIIVADADKMPFVELFVEIVCSNCPKSEEALVELMEDEVCNFVSYVGDAPGESGAIADAREDYLNATLGAGQGYPWALFNGGSNIGGGGPSKEAVKADYLAKLTTAYIDPLNVSLTGEILDSGSGITVNVTALNMDNTTESLRIQVFLLEVKSRWLNHYTHEPIPYAVVDLLANDTHDIAGGAAEALSLVWAGTDTVDYVDVRISNLAAMAVVWNGEVLVTSKLIESGIPELLWLTSEDPTGAALPNGSATFGMTLHNFQDAPVTMNLTVRNVPVNWTRSVSGDNVVVDVFSPTRTYYYLGVPANSSETFAVTLTGTWTQVGDAATVTVQAEDVTDPTLSSTAKISVDVRSDITPPVFGQIRHSPELPMATDEIEFTAVVGDNVGLSSVVLQYYSCTDEICSPNVLVNMSLSGNAYVPDETITPVEPVHNIFHYKIIATDLSGNVNESAWLDIKLEPTHAHHDDVPSSNNFVTMGIGMLLIFAMVAIGLNVARMKRPPASEPQESPEGDVDGTKDAGLKKDATSGDESRSNENDGSEDE